MEKSKKSSWKEIFSFTSGGKLKSLELIYSFTLGICILLVNFFISNLLTILFEKWFGGLSLTWKNIMSIAVPSLLCVALFAGLFCLLKNKRIVPTAYYMDMLLIVIVLIILLFKLSKDTLTVLLPVFLYIFAIPALVGTVVITVLFCRWRKKPAQGVPDGDH